MFKEGDIVHLPMGEIGIIVSTGAAFFEYDYFCRILKATLSDVGTIGGPYKNQELKLVNYREVISNTLYNDAFAIINFFKDQVNNDRTSQYDDTLKWHNPAIENVKIKLSNYNSYLKELEKNAPNYNIEHYNRVVKNIKNTRNEYKNLLKLKFNY